MPSLCDVHDINAYRVDHVRPHDSNRESVYGLRLNLISTLCYYRLPQTRAFQFPPIDNTNMADERTSEMGMTKLCRYRHAGAKGERRYNSYSLLTSSLDGVSD